MSDSKKQREFMTPEEFRREVCDWSYSTLKRRILNDGFPAVKVDKGYLIPVEQAKLWFKKRSVA